MDLETYIGRKVYKQIQGENGHLQVKERGLEHILPSQSSEGTHPDNIVQAPSIHSDEIRNLCCCKPVRHTIHLLMQGMQVGSPGQEDPLEEELAVHSRILAREIPWTEGPGQAQLSN